MSRVSVIVTHHQTPEMLRLCLNSIREAGEGLNYEIIVADTEAEEETALMLGENFSETVLLTFEKNVGFTKLVNAGIARSNGDFVLILNADMVLKKDSIKNLLQYLEANPEVGIAGPQLLNFNETVQESCFRFYRLFTIVCRRTFVGKTSVGKKEISRFLMRDFDHQSTREVDWMMGTALMARRKAMKEVGLWDERFFMYFEDTDWCRRFWKAGWKVIYYPKAQMFHYHGRASRKTKGVSDIFFNKYTWIHISSAIKYFLKYGGTMEFEKRV